jgi:DNA-binding SARP family transcriptional activator
MSITIQLLGHPRITRGSGEVYRFRSRKSWGLLAYLILSEHAPARSQLASLLFAGADDPVRALRWGLAEIRRALGDGGSVDGDPVVLRLPPGSAVDVQVVTKGTWAEAVTLPGLGADLLEGTAVRGAAAFETWLLAQQRHAAAASEAILHEGALGSMARGALTEAVGYAVRAATMSPLDENHQALLIRLYRMAGDDDAAAKQVAAFTRVLGAELGAVEAGVHSLRTAARLADGAGATRLRISTRLALAEALIHALGGLDEPGLAALHEADEIALAHGLSGAAAQARAELGYVNFLRGRYDRAELWLTDALEFAGDSPSMRAKALAYLGSVASDRADYQRAAGLLEQAVTLSQAAGEPRRQAYALSCWAGSACSAVRWIPPPASSTRPSSWPSATTGWRSCPGRRPCGVRSSWPGPTRPARPGCSGMPSPGPASSATPAGKECPPGAWPWWPPHKAIPNGPSSFWPMPAPAATGWPTRTCGSTSTSSTRSASSACGTVTRTSAAGSRRCGTWRRGWT